MREHHGEAHSGYGLENHGLYNLNDIYWNLPTPALYEQAIYRHEAVLSHLGPLVVRTGHHTGRSATDKFIVQELSTQNDIWWGKINRPFASDKFDSLHHRLASYLQMKDVYVQDCFAGADPDHRLPIRIITEYAWHSLFARNLFIQAKSEELRRHAPAFTVIDAPRFHAIPGVDSTNSETFIIINLAKKLVLIGGTSYAGEIKKSIFSVMNYLLPFKDVLPMHCAANIGSNGETALFFGLSGTGKTTLSADSTRTLIGDDEHGWNKNGIFNFEGGCYAKMIKLSPEAEPEIHATTRRFGTVLENVTVDSVSRRLDLMDVSLTENTRGAYPISHIPNATREGRGGHPKNVVFLTADAFGVLPPISKLTRDQAIYHFLLGYTAKVAGTEKGVTEPVPNFSPCYGAPFMPLHPTRYAALLGKMIDAHNVNVWLINTGWSGGAYGVGQRISIAHTRAMVHAILDKRLDDVPLKTHPIFGLKMPMDCPDVPKKILDPRNTWADKKGYDAAAKKLAAKFAQKYEEYAAKVVSDENVASPLVV